MTAATLQSLIVHNLRDIFAVPHVALHLWKDEPPSSEVLAFADQHQLAGLHPSRRARHLALVRRMRPSICVRSPICRCVRNGQTIGLLILASEDKQRFYPEMGTLFLQRIAETLGSAFHLHV